MQKLILMKKHLIINKNKITFSQETNLNNINWKKYGVDYVFECTGKFNSKDKLEAPFKKWSQKSYCFSSM